MTHACSYLACGHVIYVYGRAGARTKMYLTCCAAGKTFGNHAGHNTLPLGCDPWPPTCWGGGVSSGRWNSVSNVLLVTPSSAAPCGTLPESAVPVRHERVRKERKKPAKETLQSAESAFPGSFPSGGWSPAHAICLGIPLREGPPGLVL